MKVYFKGEFSIRGPISIGVAVVLTLGGLSLGAIWLSQIRNGVGLKDVAGLFFASLFSLVLLAGGSFLLFRIVKNEKTVILITSEGIEYGKQHYCWEEVTEVGVMSKYTRRKDLYCATRLHPFAIELLTSKGLKAEEIRALFGVLRAEVLRAYPHIHLSEEDAV